MRLDRCASSAAATSAHCMHAKFAHTTIVTGAVVGPRTGAFAEIDRQPLVRAARRRIDGERHLLVELDEALVELAQRHAVGEQLLGTRARLGDAARRSSRRPTTATRGAR